jgi:hypothetical protein
LFSIRDARELSSAFARTSDPGIDADPETKWPRRTILPHLQKTNPLFLGEVTVYRLDKVNAHDIDFSDNVVVQ